MIGRYYLARFGQPGRDTSAVAIYVKAGNPEEAKQIGEWIATVHKHPETKNAYSRGIASNIPDVNVPKGCFYLENIHGIVRSKD